MTNHPVSGKLLYDFLDVTALTAEQLTDAFRCMSVTQQKRISSFRNGDDVVRSIGADLLGRLTASRFLGIPPEKVRIIRHPSGQPAIKGSDCFISLSHAGSLAMCAVSSRPVGADIESPRRNAERVCRRICRKAELDYIYASGEYDPNRFAAVWTAKEAVLKMHGKGLGGGISTVEVADRNGILSLTPTYRLISGIHCGMVFSVAEEI